MFVLPSIETRRLHTADTQVMRSQNASVVANLAWAQPEGISRAELARESGLSASTVSAIVADLIAAGLLTSSHQGPSRGGRPPLILRFETSRNHIIGVELGASHVAVALCDLSARVRWHEARDFDVARAPEPTLALVFDLIERARRRSEAKGRLLGLGVAVPCPVDSLAPDRLSSRLFPAWADVRLAAELHRRFRIRVFVDNDANCGALAEAHIGAGVDLSELTFIKVATGVGAGHIVDGRLYRGYNGIAGEIGHTSVDPGGRLCRCGLRGCLEAEVGSGAIVAKAREALAAGRPSSLSPSATLAEIVSAARRGDPLARELITEAGRHLGVGVANLLNLMNPARVIIGGRLAEAGALLLEPLRAAVRERALWTAVERADVVISTLGEPQVASGAATLVLRAALTDLSLFWAPDASAPRAAGPTSRIWKAGGHGHA